MITSHQIQQQKEVVMKSTAGSCLKSDWMEMPGECFEPLTFGELKIGQKFICLPLPGDNNGHGGFRVAYDVFTKTHEIVTEAARWIALRHSPAEQQTIAGTFPEILVNSMFVILVE